MLIGAHVSIAGGFDKCLDRIFQMGGNCLMTFASPPRSLNTKPFPQQTINSYLKKKLALNIGPHFFHCVYLINLASNKQSYVDKCVETLIFYQQLAGEIQGAGTIFHVGSHLGRGFKAVRDQVVKAVNCVIDSTPAGVKLYLENTAGQNGSIGSFAEVREIVDGVGDKSKIGVCLDTQHLFASGITLDKALDQFDQAIGIKYLSVLHVNDSKTDFGSHVDRHENLGQGKIGAAPLKVLLSDPRVKHLPKILEVPGSGQGPRKQDVDALKSLLLSR